jgi:hypothetical protein
VIRRMGPTDLARRLCPLRDGRRTARGPIVAGREDSEVGRAADRRAGADNSSRGRRGTKKAGRSAARQSGEPPGVRSTRLQWPVLSHRCENRLGPPPDGSVTFAGHFFQPIPVKHVDATTVVPDQASFLEFARYHRHGCPSHGQHLGEVVMGQLQLEVVHTIDRLEQPARQAGFDLMQRVARGRESVARRSPWRSPGFSRRRG